MTREELNNLKDGALIKIEGTNWQGKTERHFCIFKREQLKKNGYMFCCALYPVEWIKEPTKKDLVKLCDEVREQAQKQVEKYCDAYVLTKGSILK